MGCAALVIRELVDTPYDFAQRQTGHCCSAQHNDGAPADSTFTPVRGPTGTAKPADPDVIDDLGDEIATLSAHIHAATHRLLVLIAEVDRLHGWELAGYSNCAPWLAVRTGIDLGTAREKVSGAGVDGAATDQCGNVAGRIVVFEGARAVACSASRE